MSEANATGAQSGAATLRRYLAWRASHPRAADDPRGAPPPHQSACGHAGIVDMGQIRCRDCGRLSWSPTYGILSAWCDPCYLKRIRGFAAFASED